MTGLLVAAGGGGDAIAAAIINAALHGPDHPAVILTYAWDRLAVDPLPGPRTHADFTGLGTLADGVPLVRPETRAVSPAGSTLPRLAAELPHRIGLLDPTHGARGMAAQIDAAAQAVGADRIEIVDVGGDILAHGGEPTLRSPLADALTLAAAAHAALPTVVHVAGPGLDGELNPDDLADRLPPAALTLTAEYTSLAAALLDWHPSEATALLVAAARGIRGTCEVRDAGLPVHLTDHSAAVHTLDADDALDTNRLAAALLAADTLPQAEQLSRDLCGFSEIDYERNKASWLAQHTPAPFDPAAALDQLDRFHTEARARGSQFATLRRIAEALSTPGPHRNALRDHLAAVRPELHEPPLWRIPPH